MMKFLGKKAVKIVLSILFVLVCAYFIAARFAPYELDNFKRVVGSKISWLDFRGKISDDYIGKTGFSKIDKSAYNKLVADKKTAIIFVDSTACHTADRMREWLSDYSRDKKVQILQMMWSEVQESYLHDHVKYYPSLVIVKDGEVVKALDANEDRDAVFYNNKDKLLEWIEYYIRF